jgi:N-methylhydantoinase A
VEARYLFQVWELDVPLPQDRFRTAEDVAKLVSAFHLAHERVLGVRDPVSPIECLNWKGRITAYLAAMPSNLTQSDRHATTTDPQSYRQAFFGSRTGVRCPVYRGSRLRPQFVIKGPAIIEEPTTTIVIYPEMAGCLSALGNYVLTTT